MDFSIGRFRVKNLAGEILKPTSLTNFRSDETMVASTSKAKRSIFDETDIDKPTDPVLRRASFFVKPEDAAKVPTGISLYEEDLRDWRLGSNPDAGNDLQKANLGTFFGVFLPCCQNIVGVIFFVRFPWIVGAAGMWEGLIIVGLCCLVSFTVAISISAIATNGKVTGGGTYFMISRSLGPGFGGSVGILFFMGTSISVAMYYIGTVETLLNYIAPELSLFEGEYGRFHDYRVYGTILLMMMTVVVFIGVTCVQRFGLFAILFLVAALISVLTGVMLANEETSVKVCLFGNRVMVYNSVYYNNSWHCDKSTNGPLYKAFCPNKTCSDFFNDNTPKVIPAIPGFDLDILTDNLYSKYLDKGGTAGVVSPDTPTTLDVQSDIATSFVILMAIYFPSITGVESGSNYSGDLRDPHRSIPFGTMSAVIVTSTLYMFCVVFFAGSVEGHVLVDKYGHSISGTGELMLSLLAWPSKWVVLVGTLTATTGAGLQALAGGPRLLLAIATDGIFPFLSFFSTTWKGEPTRCLCVTFSLALTGILISQLDLVAPIVTMFFLMCYGFINFAVTLQSLLDTPHWRPSFKCYHWIVTLFGSALCVTIMFMTSWIYALVAIGIATFLYEYIEYKGAEKEWGDGMTGLSMSAAIYALRRLKSDYSGHTKNWRPQLLVLLKPFETETLTFEQDNLALIRLSVMLQMGRGLTMYTSVIRGSLAEHADEIKNYKQLFRAKLDAVGAKGFVELAVSENIPDALSCMIQCSGLGPLHPNTVIMGWPWEWSQNHNVLAHRIFLDIMKNVALCNNALIVVKNHGFPNVTERLVGTIDIWWIVNDGGMLLLLAHLIKRTKTFARCTIRVFSVAEAKDNTIQIEKDLKTHLYDLRMDCTVEVVEMTTENISAYVYERTLKLEERNRMLSFMRKKSKLEVQDVLEKARSYADLGKSGTSSNDGDNKPPTMLPSAQNVRHMNTAIQLNKMMVDKSQQAQLIILNLPCAPQKPAAQANYMSFLEVLTEGLDNCLMVRGTGAEVITIFN